MTARRRSSPAFRAPATRTPRGAASPATVLALLEAGDLRRAERDARALLDASPHDPERLHLHARVCLARGRVDEAIAQLERAVAAAPVEPRHHEALAAAWLRRGEPERAESAALLAERCAPDRALTQLLLGVARLERGDPVAAMEPLARAIELEPPHLEAMTHMAVAMNRAGLWAEAERWGRTLLKLDPARPETWINLGMSLKGQRRLAEAAASFERAGDHPAARFNLGYVRMLEGNLRAGLPLLEHRKALLPVGRALRRPEWDGREGRGRTLLVVHEQGLGDTLLMCRFWPALLERFDRVVALVQPPLERLLRTAFPRVDMATSLDGVAYDTWCATMSLPWLLGLDDARSIPLAPWITLPEAAPDRARAADAPRPLRAGLNWAGNPRYAYDTVRSARLADVGWLLRAPGIEWVSLHRGAREHEAVAAGLPQPLATAQDFLDTAEIVRDLDLVVSTETAIPNLSAALGVPTLVLASPDWDWRWAHWYAGVTVCAQDTPGDWTSACTKALEAIRDFMVARAGAAA